MNEFELIDAIVDVLDPVSAGGDIVVGPGDDCCVTSVPGGHQLVSSIDTLIAGRHFPRDAEPFHIGYRAMMVSLSDLAAMGADPHMAMVALSLENLDAQWVRSLAEGMRQAAEICGVPIAGGNIARGALSLSVSVHGLVETGAAVLRSGASAGDAVYVTGALGGAAAALEQKFTEAALRQRYFLPRARLDLASQLRSWASAAIDISDGLLQDLAHVAKASGVAIDLIEAKIPVFPGAELRHALEGGDDYEICFTAAQAPDFDAVEIGRVVEGEGVMIDGKPVDPRGYQHFA